MPSRAVTTPSLTRVWSRTTIVGTIGRGRAFGGLLAVTAVMPEFKPGDRVSILGWVPGVTIAGHIVERFSPHAWHAKITHSNDGDVGVGATHVFPDFALEHLD